MPLANGITGNKKFNTQKHGVPCQFDTYLYNVNFIDDRSPEPLSYNQPSGYQCQNGILEKTTALF